MEQTLQDLLEEVPLSESPSDTPKKDKITETPWLLTEKNLLCKVKLDYAVNDIIEGTSVEEDMKPHATLPL